MAFSVGSSNNAGLAKNSLANAHRNLQSGRNRRDATFNQNLKIGGIEQLMGLLGIGGGGGGLSQPGGPDGGAGGVGGGFDGILGGQEDQLNSLLGDISGLGDADRQRIGRQFDAAGNTEIARLEDRGFGASNLGGEAIGSIEDSRSQALADLSQQLLGNKIGVKERSFAGQNDTKRGAIDHQLKQQQLQQDMFKSLLGAI